MPEVWSRDASSPVVQRLEHHFGLTIDKLVNETVLRQLVDPWLLEHPGGIGCMLSHLWLMKDFLENTTDDFLFIAEDDIGVHRRFNQLEFERFFDSLPRNQAVIGMAYSWASGRKYFDKTSRVQLGPYRSLYRFVNHQLFYHKMSYGEYEQHYRICSTAAYVLTRKSADNILNNAFPVYTSADWFHAYFERGLIDSLWGVEPILFRTRNVLSSTNNPSLSKRRATRVHFLHQPAQFCVDYKIPILSHYVNLRRLKRYGTKAGQKTQFV